MIVRSTFLALALSLSSALAQTAFVPNDPYFNSGTAAGATDGFYGEWHLQNQMPVTADNAGLDANITSAWARGLTGAGVTIGIVDDGVQGDHPDIINKFNNALSWDFGKTQAENLADTSRGSPVETYNNHGTSVAGVAAAEGGNGIGVTGAAPFATIASLRNAYVDGSIPAPAHIAAILYQGQTDINGNPDPYATNTWASVPIRVKNHSYGEPYGFIHAAGVSEALATSASHGVIHVAAAGNQSVDGFNPNPTLDSNKDQIQSSPDVITVSAVASNGQLATYSSIGSNVFVSALTDDTSNDRFSITTVDRTTKAAGYNGTDRYLADDGDYTSRFGGTSSASPLVAGIMALGVQARPDLDMRLAKHALALSSRRIELSDPSWITNAAGYSYSSKYGFGLIDADAFTMTLQNGLAISAGQVAQGTTTAVNQTFASSSSLLVNYAANFDNPLPLEYVKVSMTITGLKTDWADYIANGGSIQGDFSAWITSPDGTRYQLFANDRSLAPDQWEERRNYEGNSLVWDFTSYAYWGEHLNGLWSIELDDYALDPSATWSNFTFEAGQGSILAVPEPGTWILFTVAIAVITFRRRKKMGTLGEPSLPL